MKRILLLSLLILSFNNYGQEVIDSTAVANLKNYHSSLNNLMIGYDGLDDKKKQKFNDLCDEAEPYYRFLSAKKIVPVDTLLKYDVTQVCSSFKAKEALTKFSKNTEKLESNQAEFEKLLDSLKRINISSDSNVFTSITERLNQLKDEINKQCDKVEEELMTLKVMDGISAEELSGIESTGCKDYEKGVDVKNQTNNYVIVGDNDPIEAEKLFDPDVGRNILNQVMSLKNSTELGNFEIPANNAEITLYLETPLSLSNYKFDNYYETFIRVDEFLNYLCKSNHANTLKNKNVIKGIRSVQKLKLKENDAQEWCNVDLPQKILFKSLHFEMKEGGLVDIRLEAMDINNKVKMYFESRAPVSLLNYTRRSSKAFLHFSNESKTNIGLPYWNYKVLRYLRIKVSDVLRYTPKAGNNFVPDDITLDLPKNPDGENDDNSSRSYKLISDSSLKNLIDLRTYTDILGLFANESNGLFQIEGKADFYLNPFNFDRTSVYPFKKITPFLRYSRLEEDSDFISTQFNDLDILNENLVFRDEPIDLIEKSNLEFGIDLNLLTFRLFKESPVWMSVHTPINLYHTKVRPTLIEENQMEIGEGQEQDSQDAENDFNFSTVGYGLGFNWEVRRLKNFGLNLGTYFKWYSYIGNYDEYNLLEPNNLKTFSLDAEVFYYPGEKEDQSIFIRMRTFRDITNGNSAFQQIQFGYRFTIGAGKVKAND